MITCDRLCTGAVEQPAFKLMTSSPCQEGFAEMSLQSQPYASFFIRLWQEPRDGDTPVWRGSIEHVQTGHRHYFLETQVPLTFIEQVVDHTNSEDEPRTYIG